LPFSIDRIEAETIRAATDYCRYCPLSLKAGSGQPLISTFSAELFTYFRFLSAAAAADDAASRY
jgi:hypothetical protein